MNQQNKAAMAKFSGLKGLHVQTYAHAYGYAEMCRPVHLSLLQVST